MRKEKELAQWSPGSFSFLLYYGPCSPQDYFSFTIGLAVRTAISPLIPLRGLFLLRTSAI